MALNSYVILPETHSFQWIISNSIKPVKNNKLSDQENFILSLVAEGKTNDKIEDILNIASNTVNIHRENIRKKLDLKRGKSILLQYVIYQKNYYG